MKHIKLKNRKISNDIFPQTNSDRPPSTDSTKTTADRTVATWREVFTSEFLEELNPRFLCVECNRPLEFPVALSQCDHHACSECISRLWKRSRSCPLDSKPIDRNEVTIDEKLQAEINDLTINCQSKHKGCHWSGAYQEYKKHYSECAFTEEICVNGCGFRSTKGLMDKHLQLDCSRRLMPCEFCKLQLKAEDEIEHLKSCGRFLVACPKNCGKKEIPREDVAGHLELECHLADKACPYDVAGCPFKSSRAELSNHVEECFKNHVSLLCDGFRKHSKMLQAQDNQLLEQRPLLSDLEKKINRLARDNDVQLLWKISDWSIKQSEAVSGKRPVIQSPHFYTARHQYKLAVLLLPNGDGKAKGTCLSLYVRLCKGEYDALLAWPFCLPIEISLIDQSQDPRARMDHAYTLRPNPCKENKPFLGRPTSESNPSFGSQTFMPLDTVNTRDYVRDDTIFIRVTVLQG